MYQQEGRQYPAIYLQNHSRIILIGTGGWGRFYGGRIIPSWQRSVGGLTGSSAAAALGIWARIILTSHNGLWVLTKRGRQGYIRLMDMIASGLVSSMLME